MDTVRNSFKKKKKKKPKSSWISYAYKWLWLILVSVSISAEWFYISVLYRFYMGFITVMNISVLSPYIYEQCDVI